jgi:hypothetical protein
MVSKADHGSVPLGRRFHADGAARVKDQYARIHGAAQFMCLGWGMCIRRFDEWRPADYSKRWVKMEFADLEQFDAQ